MGPLLRVLKSQHASRFFTLLQKPKSQLLQSVRVNQLRRYAHAFQSPAKMTHKIGERVLVFHADTLRITFVGLLKATTVIIFFGNLFLVSPKIYLYPTANQPIWFAPVVAISGGIPMVYVMWASAPFVVSATLKKVPLSARRSIDHLLRWADKLPHDSEIEFRMFKWYGLFRTTTVPISQLRTKKPRLGIENLTRLDSPKDQPKLFYVGKERKVNSRVRLWQEIVSQIEPVSTSDKA